MAEILLNASGLSKSFAGQVLFSNVSFSLSSGERTGLVGPNGAGKSTLVSILAAEATADEGSVIRTRGLRVGYLMQNPKFQKDHSILQALLAESGSSDLWTEAYEWMAKLDLLQFGEALVSELSGGWQKRVALARELMKTPQILFLDEPTNHLDVSGILWLEEFLANAPYAVFVVTHDRLFLQRVCNQIMDLDFRNPGYLLTFKKDYLLYLEEKEQILAAQRKKENVLSNTMRREREWLARGAKARQTKQKARIERAQDLNEEVSDLREKNQTRLASIQFSDSSRVPKKLVELKDVSFSYPNMPIINNFSYLLSGRARVGLIGENGVGKSTFLRLICGLEKPTTGHIESYDGLSIAYFEQHKATIDLSQSVLRNVCSEGDYVHFQNQAIFAKSYLSRFLFRTNQMDMPAEKLSGGERSRLRIAQLMLQPSQLLILDEPTNDLDVATLNVLESAIQEFPGAVILVSHDRYFLDQVSHEILAFHRFDASGVEIQRFANYFQWENWYFDRKAEEKGKSSDESKKRITKEKSKDKKSEEIKGRLSFKEKFELDSMEAKITALENEIQSLKSEIENPANVSNSKFIFSQTQKLSMLEEELNTLFSRWQELVHRVGDT